MRRIDRKSLRAPARVLDLELTATDLVDDTLEVEQYSTLWCLSRLRGIPQEISFWDVAEDAKVSTQYLCDHLRTGQTTHDSEGGLSLSSQLSKLDTTVVICTRDRPLGLRATLRSLQRQTDSDFRVLVVDNGSNPRESATVVAAVELSKREYVIESRPGLSRARNRALGEVRTNLVAWIDDDEVADPEWVRRLKEGFTHEARPAAVCGVMLPAELEFEAQVRFEQYGGFNKGRTMTAEVLRTGLPSIVSPLYPLPAFGAGGNMAFRTESLRSVQGFDTCLGAGTRTHGCEETSVLSLLLLAGHAVLHWPAAITWHTHRREMAALRKQFYGYSAGLSAYYASMIRSKPSVAFDLLHLVPHVLRDLSSGSKNLRSGHLPDDFPGDLLKASRRGLLEGSFMYAYEAIRERFKPVLAIKESAPNDATFS